MFRFGIIVAALAVLVGACSANAEIAPGDGRLLILDDTGNVVTMAPDGTDIVAVVDDGGGRVTYFQPIWSPDGSHISVTRSEAGTFSIEVIDVTTGERESTVTDSNSFYQSWSPDGSQLASLSATGPGSSVLTFSRSGRRAFRPVSPRVSRSTSPGVPNPPSSSPTSGTLRSRSCFPRGPLPSSGRPATSRHRSGLRTASCTSA